ncbi:MAG: hypothetical protein M1484_03520 [Patescibacteria group bacterium]|nr:hypothetical protein [Patescibacteria group bacterium]MCL5432132.1 hypothetical protein [Patescibacteria group bacterium]
MTATAHAIVGAAIASKIPNPVIALPIIFVSHFLGDKLPHWDPMTAAKTKTKAQIFWQTVADVLLGYSLVLLFIWYKDLNPVYILLGAFTAQLPDWLELPHMFTDRKFVFSEINYKVQKWFHDIGFNSRMAAPWGVVPQALVAGAFLLWALI